MSAEKIADVASEAALLGAVIAQQKRMAEVASLVQPDDFSDPRHVAIYETLLALDAEGRPFDTLIIADALRSAGSLAKIGLAYLAELDTAAPLVTNAGEYARIVAEHASRRRMFTGAADVARQAAKGEASPAELAALAQEKLVDALPPEPGRGMQPMASVLERTLDRMEKAQRTGGGVTGLRTGYVDLDALTTGLQPAQMIVLAARPGIGKSALAMNIAGYVGNTDRKPVAVFSLEMSDVELGERMLSASSEVALNKIRGGQLSDYELKKINDASQQLWGGAVHVYEGGAVTPYEIRNQLRRMQSKGTPPALVIVDYLQLMGASGRHSSREQEVAANSRAMKLMAKEFNVPFLVLSQLNRKSEDREGPPRLSDLRESGSIEQDADVVMFLHPEDRERDEASEINAPLELILAKQRSGPAGRVGLMFRKEITRFYSRSSR